MLLSSLPHGRTMKCVISRRPRTAEPTLTEERWFLSVCYRKAEAIPPAPAPVSLRPCKGEETMDRMSDPSPGANAGRPPLRVGRPPGAPRPARHADPPADRRGPGARGASAHAGGPPGPRDVHDHQRRLPPRKDVPR